MDNEKLMNTWCQMWSEDPALAHEVMSGRCTQWSGQTATLDTVVGPSQQEEFITAYRAQHVNVFTPRVLVDAGDRFAYLWDVTRPDGSMGTGMDLNIVRDGLIEENWTFVTPQRLPGPDPEPSDSAGAAGVLDDMAARWVQVVAGRADLAPGLVSEDFRLLAGGDDSGHGLRGPTALIGSGHVRRDRPAPVVTVHRDPVIDTRRGRIALLRTTSRATGNADPVGGVDLLTVRDGRVTHAWSLPAIRAFTY